MLDQIKSWLERDKSVKRVAEDLELTSELILLVRMIFADGKLKSEELSRFKRLCQAVFDIPKDDVGDVLQYLQEFGYETSAGDAAGIFENLDMERKKTLLAHMISIAKADNEVHAGEIDLIKRTASILKIGEAEMKDVLEMEKSIQADISNT